MNRTKLRLSFCRWGLLLLILIYSNTVLAETASDKTISDERAITGLVTKVETFNKEKTSSPSENIASKTPAIETDLKEYVVTLKNLPNSYRIKLGPTTAITAGDRTIYPASLKTDEDFITIKYADTGNKIAINSITLKKIKTPKRVKLMSMAFGISLTLILLVAVSGALKSAGGGLFVGQDNRYSNSKFQMAMWIFIGIFSYVTLFFQRYFAGTDILSFASIINIPENLGILMGISTGSFVGAKAITASQVTSGAITKSKASKPLLLDLITDDKKVIDLGDLQMFSWTLIGALIYLLNFYRMWLYLDPSIEVSLPTVDSSILALTGISQAAYIGKKLVSK
ncbi:MAG: hypothetical protein FD156_1126 [Nitrospirae bacterium]|nr:MAG: hypothetical protein FD156_1126 [Nitrospirota bacterium]